MASGGWLHRDKHIKFIVLTHLEKGNLQHSSELLNWYAVPTMLERTAGRLARDLVRVNGFDPRCLVGAWGSSRLARDTHETQHQTPASTNEHPRIGPQKGQ